MKILNLYSGIGGNRKLWGDEHQVTAVEYKPDIAAVYRDYFPNDTVVVGDAHKYLLDHYEEFDFIWSSPPCTTHSQVGRLRAFNKHNESTGQYSPPRYPDMSLYQEILLLKHFFKGKWLVENVISYYTPLIPPQQMGRHWYWSNFHIPYIDVEADNIGDGKVKDWEERFGYNLGKYKGINRRMVLRNCVTPKVGEYILKHALKPDLANISLFL